MLVLCSGFPSRFKFSLDNIKIYNSLFKKFGKIRMLGAASISLLQVAKGSADAYSENDIMLWDVGAGLAIVEGAGGSIKMIKGNIKNSIKVSASNGIIKF